MRAIDASTPTLVYEVRATFAGSLTHPDGALELQVEAQPRPGAPTPHPALYLELVDTTAGAIEQVTLFTGNTAGDTINIQSTQTGSVYNIATQAGNDTVNIASTAAALIGAANLDGMLGRVRLDLGSGTDSLNISDYGAGVADTYLVEETGANQQTRVTFNGGVLADDVLYSFNRVLDPETASPSASYASGIADMTAPDAATVHS